jgi:hypothetical protein
MGSKQSEGRRKMVVYPITGRQFWFLSVPHSWCRECDLTIRAVSSVAAEVGDTVEVEVKPLYAFMGCCAPPPFQPAVGAIA